MKYSLSSSRHVRLVTAAVLVAGLTSASGQTRVTLDPNRYSIQDDVKLGQEAAAEVRRELPMLDDDRVDNWVEEIGRTLVNGIPSEFRHDGFRYSFDVVNQREINAFALPGGPMFLNRGMIEAAASEGEVAGVMAHEIAHVALRHGTAQASKAQTPAILGTIGQIVGGVLGGTVGGVIGLGSQIGATAWITKYSREYERQADLLGAQIMARVGYNPREMASMFRTIEEQGGGGGPEFLSSHPNPGNRYEAINREAASLRVQGNASTGDFASIQSRLRGMSPAYTAEQIARGQARTAGGSGGTIGNRGRTVRVAAPSGQYRTHTPAQFLRLSVPSNWEQVGGNGATYVPEGAFFTGDNGATAFTHGVQVGTAQGSGNLQRDTQQLVQGLSRSNPELRSAGSARRETVSGRQAIVTPLSNVSEVTGQREYVSLMTTQLRDGSILYLVGVAPQSEAQTYDTAFRRVRQSVQIADR
jgi:hypothetical protein